MALFKIMKTKWIEVMIIVMALGLLSLCFASWDNDLPADSDAITTWPTSIRANWDALETLLGVDLTTVTGVGIINVFNVQNPSYGAIGDGVEDDTAAIQAASTAAGTDGIVFFPDGEYKVTDAGGLPIIYDPRVLFIGESREGVIITNTSTTNYSFQFHSPIGDAYVAYANPGGFFRMQINGKFGIKFNQTLAEIGGIWSGDWNEQDHTLGWKIHDISFKGDYSCQGDANRDTNTEPASIADYTTYGIGLLIVRPYQTDISQCAFRGHGVGLFMEGADLTYINNNRFMQNSCHLYATNGTDSNAGYNSIFSHNDILTCYRRRHIWIEGQDGKLGGWSICDNFFEESGPQAEQLYINGGLLHKIYANFWGGSSTDPGTTPMISFVGAGYSHLVYGNVYSVNTYLRTINVDWLTGTREGRKWIHFFGNSKEFPVPDNPRGILGAQEDSDPFVFDCISNQTKFEEGTAHADSDCFAKFDGFYHLDTSTGTVDMFFRDGRVDRLEEYTLHIQGVATGGADGDDNQLLIIYHDAVEDYNANFLTNLTDGDVIDERVPITSAAGIKRIYFSGGAGVGYLAISSITIEPNITQAYTETNVTEDRAFNANTVAIAELADIVGTLIVDLRARGIVE